MHSIALIQAVRTELEVAGVKSKDEPQQRRAIAEAVYARFRDELFSLADRRSAAMAHIMSLVTSMMKEPLTQEELDGICLPRKSAATFQNLPQWICVGGANHRKSIYASGDDWITNSRILHRHAEQVMVPANAALDIGTWLKAEGLGSMADLMEKKVAA